MNPLRWDVLLVGFALAVPVLALGLRGDLSPEDMMNRVLWCLGAGWAVVAVFRLATTPPPPAPKSTAAPVTRQAESGEPSPAL
ncbi:MAG: hypothetical protein AVDCRST_MAG52-168 [uncultured Blastococcus sp.]|uniref:Uncharacterized protein n=1 Tax=uncultured Blastococcus sp. TaxID=217144 RepID=A0A6J4H7Z3_9ACTN|nr:MAG: hypothetical protein AVDCRST_MAG52-168 [uncultured Blastococcus sp.]